MRRSIPPLSAAADRPLTSQNLLSDFGARAAVTREGVQTLLAALQCGNGSNITRKSDNGEPPLHGSSVGRRPLSRNSFQAEASRRGGNSAPAQWQSHLARLVGRDGLSSAADAASLLLALQTYYAMLVKLLAERFGLGRIDEGLPNNPFSWCDSARSRTIGLLADRLRAALAGYRRDPAADDGDCDLFKSLYQNLFPRALRRQLGEYYTPDWLAQHLLDQVGYSGEPGRRLLDPACGSGTFLLLALRRMTKRAADERRGMEEPSGRRPPGVSHPIHSTQALIPNTSPLARCIVGFDLNPLAVITARTNYLLAVADLPPKDRPAQAPIYLRDSILGGSEDGKDDREMFDFVVGNPPWIAWDNLPEEDRQATKPLWKRYGLFSLSGSDARHGGGKKDLSMLMLYAAADRYLKSRGRLGMIVTQTLFQTRGAGDGFRRFRLGAEGPPLGVLRVDDMVALRPFGDAANWTSAIVLEKGVATSYPVPYFVWSAGDGKTRGAVDKDLEVLLPSPASGRGVGGEGGQNKTLKLFLDHCSGRRKGVLNASCRACLARPIDPASPTSPWLVEEVGYQRPDAARRPAAIRHGSGQRQSLPLDHGLSSCAPFYSAHLGANSGGANGVYWVEMLGQREGGALVRNVADKSKRPIDRVERVIEPDLLYPLLRWGNVRRWSASPRGCILLAQNPATRTGIDEGVMRERFPRTLAYLELFRDVLISRAAYRRYQDRGPFYSMYNVGAYTIAPVKVVWRRMDRRINAAVVEGVMPRPAVPQETCVLLACDSSDEAHYLCAMLNSAVLNELVAAHSVRGGKGFGTPGMLEYLPLARYCPDDPRHVELAALSRRAHAILAPRSPQGGRGECDTPAIAELQRRIDELAGQ